jgi:hypothetical protein
MLAKKRSPVVAIVGGIVSIIILAAAGWLLLNRQYAIDQVTIWGYTPSSNIADINDRVDFTNEGQFYFYATRPEVAGDEQFNLDCPRQEVGNPILGCYANQRIFIYDITNPQLDGMEEVTAAHEMLHAVWERMDTNEQSKIGALLRLEYQKFADNKELTERMDYYQRTEPGQFENELHSILATEQASLNPELEKYYSQFFTDRQVIVGLHAKYDTVFKNLKVQSDTLYDELTRLGLDVEARTAAYNTNIAQLSRDIESFNARANSGSFSSASQFNNERAALLARSNQTDAERDRISADIDAYNVKYAKYQEIASQIEVLNKSIDSIKALDPTPSV